MPHTHTHAFNGPFSGTTLVSRYQKGKTNLDFTEARDSEWQWHQLGHMQVCISLQTDNHASTPPLKVFLQAGCPSCRPTNSIKALKAQLSLCHRVQYWWSYISARYYHIRWTFDRLIVKIKRVHPFLWFTVYISLKRCTVNALVVNETSSG